jgi:Tol biopolymer transport system component
MTRARDIEQVLDEWFEEGPVRIADRVVDDALLTIDRTTQTRAAWRLPRRSTMTHTMRLAAIGLAAVAVIAIGAGILTRPSTGVGGPGTSPSTLPTAAPSAPPSASPSAAAVRALTGDVVFEHFGGRLDSASPKPNENAISRLWLAGPDGFARELLPDRPGQQGGPSWSADGTRVAFTELGDIERIYATTAAGDTPVLLDTKCAAECDDNEPGFSPDGTRIVFRRVMLTAGRTAPVSSVLATMDLSTGKVTELSATKVKAVDSSWNEYPRWSPDGSRLVFYRPVAGPDGIPISSSLFIVDADGGNLHEISTVPFAGNAQWSPDGSVIAFSTYPSHIDKIDQVAGATQNVYTVGPDGSGLTQLTTDGVSSSPSWTSDGRIVFVRAPLNNGISASDLWFMDGDGQNLTRLTRFVDGPGQCCSFYAVAQPTP